MMAGDSKVFSWWVDEFRKGLRKTMAEPKIDTRVSIYITVGAMNIEYTFNRETLSLNASEITLLINQLNDLVGSAIQSLESLKRKIATTQLPF
jgi:hypothetical protein